MQVILKFGPDEELQARQAIAGTDALLALLEMREWLRDQVKYQDAGEEMEKVRAYFLTMLDERGLDLEALLP